MELTSNPLFTYMMVSMLKYLNSQVSGTENDRAFHRNSKHDKKKQNVEALPYFYPSACLQFRYFQTLESVHKFTDLFVLLLQCFSMLTIYHITYVFLMPSNTADVRTGKHSLDRNVQNVFTRTKQKIISYHRSISDRTR